MPIHNLNHVRMNNPPTDRPKIKADQVQPGDWLVADGGHMCMQAGRTFKVRKQPRQGAFISCDHGRHYLDHTTTPMGYLIGLHRKD